MEALWCEDCGHWASFQTLQVRLAWGAGLKSTETPSPKSWPSCKARRSFEPCHVNVCRFFKFWNPSLWSDSDRLSLHRFKKRPWRRLAHSASHSRKNWNGTNVKLLRRTLFSVWSVTLLAQWERFSCRCNTTFAPTFRGQPAAIPPIPRVFAFGDVLDVREADCSARNMFSG